VSEKADMVAAARIASRLFRLFGSLRSRHGVELDEIVIYLAVGRLTFDPASGSMMMIRPTNIASLSEFLGIPRETLRRKLLRLEERDLVQRSSSGFVVKDMAVWRRLADVAGDQKADVDA
jgi:DNA-binding MarR family transcriptional regulator